MNADFQECIRNDAFWVTLSKRKRNPGIMMLPSGVFLSPRSGGCRRQVAANTASDCQALLDKHSFAVVDGAMHHKSVSCEISIYLEQS